MMVVMGMRLWTLSSAERRRPTIAVFVTFSFIILSLAALAFASGLGRRWVDAMGNFHVVTTADHRVTRERELCARRDRA